MIRKIFIANRGEIANRIIETAQKLQILTVVVGYKMDRDSLWFKNADKSILLSEDDIKDIYYNPIRICNLAKLHQCDAIHPGYGFLSENPALATLCNKENIAFIGPASGHIQLMGNKKQARAFAQSIGVPVPFAIEGSINEILKQADRIVFPAIIKSVAGGGGRGMYIINSIIDLNKKLIQASDEATKWFGQSDVYIEQYIDDARHIEVQVLADKFGNSVHLFERECSLQRRYQKVVEEAPSSSLSEKQRIELCNAALKMVKNSGYYSVGTIEFLWKNGQFWFLEMNTRIQVEHPVTEMVTGIDLIEQQIHVANNFELKIRQKDIKLLGNAIEVRLYAENPANQFKPSAGNLHYIKTFDKKNFRIDSGFENTGFISPYFDGMIAKIIGYGYNRNSALTELKSALNQMAFHGVETNHSFLNGLIASNDFITNRISTSYIDKSIEILIKNSLTDTPVEVFLASVIYKEYYGKTEQTTNFWKQVGHFKESLFSEYFVDNQSYMVEHSFDDLVLSIKFKNQSIMVNIVPFDDYHFIVHFNEKIYPIIISEGSFDYWVQSQGAIQLIKSQQKLNMAVVNKQKSSDIQQITNEIKSPLYGTISRLLTTSGQKVKQGQPLLVIESMKTENELLSPVNGVVGKIWVNEKNQVKEGETLVTFQYN